MKQKLLLALFALLTAPTAWAYDAVINGIYYNFSGENAEVTYRNKNYKSYSSNVVIPESVTWKSKLYNVTSIGDSAFYDCRNLTSVTIPRSMISIGKYAFGDGLFSGCEALNSVYITDLSAWCKINFESPISNPFNYASHLYLNGEEITDLVIPEDVVRISDYAFYNCKGLTSVIISESVTSIGKYAFSSCSGVSSIKVDEENTHFDSRDNSNAIIETSSNTLIAGCQSTVIPHSVVAIGDDAFNGCISLSSITIPNSVTSIGNSAFSGCDLLTDVIIPSSVTSIGRMAFFSCDELTSITIPESVTSIGDFAFYSCRKLASVTIPGSVTCINNSTFYGCRGLTYVTIGNGVTTISDKAFASCRKLTSISIPESLNTIGFRAFQYCDSLTAVHITDLSAWCNIKVSTDDSPLSYAKHLYLNGEEVSDLIIPSNVNKISDCVFWGFEGMTSLTISEGVKSIGGSSFRNCKGLTSVTIPNSVTSIGDRAFCDCSNLVDVYCYAEEVPKAHSYLSYAFDDSPINNATLHVPAASINKYRTTYPWSRFGRIVALTTPVNGILSDKPSFGQSYYDLAGRRLSKPQRGVNIMNGRKILK